jgi:ferrochelatase
MSTKQSFIDDLAKMVADALNELSQSIMEACEANNVGNLALKSVSWHMEISSAGVSGVGYDDDRNFVRAYQQRLSICRLL